MTRLFKDCIALLLLITPFSVFSQTTDHWETIIRVGDNCSYLVPDSEIGNDWKGKDFNDTGWTIGQSGMGYGDGDDNTVLPEGTLSVYMRFEFTVNNLSDIADLYLDMDFDDGFVAYINGTEVARENVSDPITWNMELEDIHEAGLYDGVLPERYEIGSFISSVLVTGKNVLAVEVHNHEASSSDMSSNVFLHAGIAGTQTIYGPLPDWFGSQISFTEFNLPLMLINTNGQTIPDDPRIVADMALINNGEGALNRIEDAANEYNGKISIERRGESSYGFKKRSYSIELQNDDGSNNNVSVLGLPAENDFVLYGPYSDKTMIKNVLTFELFRRTGRWASRTRYIEVMINGDYEGVYVFTEKVKRDENRVDIDKLTSDDVSPVDISGGYILRRDKTNGMAPEEWWKSPVDQPFHSTMWYDYFDPDYDELTQAQSQYIRDWMREFDEVMSGSEFADSVNGYRKYIKTKSFIDFLFINEISKGIDNYLFSTYFHKENDADGGQLVAGPPWDYNLGYGNLNYGHDWDSKETYGWCFTQGSRVYWYERLMEDEHFRNKVYCRWTKQRNSIFSTESIMAFIDNCVITLGDAVDRNFSKFPKLGDYIWPAEEPYPETYEGEIAQLKTWLTQRLEWMDEQWLDMAVCTYDPPTNIKLSNKSILNNQAMGTEIGSFSTKDPDSYSHVYTFVPGEGDDDNADFLIENNILYNNTTIDYQAQSTFTIRVASTDEANNSYDEAFNLVVSQFTLAEPNKTDAGSYTLYPNPTSGSIRIKGNADNSQFLAVDLVDLSGKVLFTYNGHLQEINNGLADDSRMLGKGVYIIRIQAEGQITTEKFIKL